MTRSQERPCSSRPTLWTKGEQTALIVVVVSLLLASAPEPATAQEWLVRFDGRVQWIAGQLMAVHPTSGHSVTVDLVGVPQSEYAGLTVGDWVVVTGAIRNGNRRVIGRSIIRGEIQAP
jgi:hypothetical protein